MKREKRLADHVRDMLAAAKQTLQYTAGMDRAGFLADVRTQQAVFFNVVMLGEAAARVMDRHAAFALAHPQVPWRAVRNQVAHGYASIDTDLVWDTVTQSLPDLLAALPAVIAEADALAGHDTLP
ncbi:DUF86 domain-containing protein [Pseudorhodoferax sp.]|uniref:HepT-like ribonuclease domain-containing protein n=1 Tax=Pseudorhodoferax sp. TaxID=1993553 RepID=UPI0039E45624